MCYGTLDLGPRPKPIIHRIIVIKEGDHPAKASLAHPSSKKLQWEFPSCSCSSRITYSFVAHRRISLYNCRTAKTTGNWVTAIKPSTASQNQAWVIIAIVEKVSCKHVMLVPAECIWDCLGKLVARHLLCALRMPAVLNPAQHSPTDLYAKPLPRSKSKYLPFFEVWLRFLMPYLYYGFRTTNLHAPTLQHLSKSPKP